MTKNRSTPILATVFTILGMLSIISSLVALVWLFVVLRDKTADWTVPAAAAAGSLVSAFLQFGVAQVVWYLARIAWATESALEMQEVVGNEIRSLRSELGSLVDHDTGDDFDDLPPAEDRYFFDDDGQEAGPYNAEQMRAMHAECDITLATRVYRSGDGQWKTLADFPELIALAEAK